MATYPVDIPSLPPLASGFNDNPAPPIAQGDVLQNDHVTAARIQDKNRKRLSECNPPLATQDEVVASKRRKHDVESANYVGAAVPSRAQNFQQALQQQMTAMQQALQQQLTAMQQALQQELQQNVQRITRVILQESQRSTNRTRNSNANELKG
jgi:glycerol-3-phosphate cytidylyltransferase-like family protein